MTREEAVEVLKERYLTCVGIGLDNHANRVNEAIDMAIEALSAEQKEEDLAKDIARRMATIIENEQDMRVILKNASTELLKDGTLKVNVKSGAEVNRVLVWGDDGCGGLYYADDRPSGEWIKATGMMPPEFHGHHCCSECGYFANMEPPFGNREDLSMFCPNCGAKMGRDTR